MAATGGNVLATRVSRSAADSVLRQVPAAEFHELARTVCLRQRPANLSSGIVGIAAAGTADLPVAEEARVTAELMDQRVQTFYDVGVAGLHRLLPNPRRCGRQAWWSWVAGMEGALPSVVGGLVDVPVLAVPTSTGYGASFGGISALLAMLNSCAAGVSVLNIDNGFGAGYQAALINRLIDTRTTTPATRPPSGHDDG